MACFRRLVYCYQTVYVCVCVCTYDHWKMEFFCVSISPENWRSKDLGMLIKDLLSFLYSDEEVEMVFSSPPIASYRSTRKIKYSTVRSKLYPVKRSVGCRGCGGSRCQVCENIKVTDTITSFTTKNTYKINHSFDCHDKYLIYIFNCKTCSKQYTGKTIEHFRRRWNNYKSTTRNAESGNIKNVTQKFLQNHLLQPDHKDFLKDVEVRLIDKTQGFDLTKREFY